MSYRMTMPVPTLDVELSKPIVVENAFSVRLIDGEIVIAASGCALRVSDSVFIRSINNDLHISDEFGGYIVVKGAPSAESPYQNT